MFSCKASTLGKERQRSRLPAPSPRRGGPAARALPPGVLLRGGVWGDGSVTGKVESVVCFAGRSWLLVLPFGARLREGGFLHGNGKNLGVFHGDRVSVWEDENLRGWMVGTTGPKENCTNALSGALTSG